MGVAVRAIATSSFEGWGVGGSLQSGSRDLDLQIGTPAETEFQELPYHLVKDSLWKRYSLYLLFFVAYFLRARVIFIVKIVENSARENRACGI